MNHSKFQWIVLLLLFSCLLPLQAAKVYRWTNDKGNVVFSDKPQEGAVTIEILEPQVYKSAPYKKITATEKKDDKFTKYKVFKFVNPGEKETVFNNAGNVDFELSINPALNVGDGHKIIFNLDGGPSKSITALKSRLTGIDRGTHTLTAQVIDKKNVSFTAPVSVTFHLRRQSIKFKKN